MPARRFPPPWSVDHSPSTRRRCSSRMVLVRDNDLVLKERYEDLAVDFARNAGREKDLDRDKPSDPESRKNSQ